MAVSIAIHGTCVSRDMFELDKTVFFNVSQYIARQTLLSSVSAPFIIHDEEFWKEGDWNKRMIQIDLEKSLFRRLKECKAKWLLVDFIDERLPVIKTENTNVTRTMYSYDYIVKESPSDAEIIHASAMDKGFLTEKCSEYAERILEIFSSDRIIVNKALYVNNYMGTDGKIHTFSKEKCAYNNMLNKYIEFIIEQIQSIWKDCHYLEFPDWALADEKHKWGLDSFHYIEKVYEYKFDELIKICSEM